MLTRSSTFTAILALDHRRHPVASTDEMGAESSEMRRTGVGIMT
jgi:hypothetical protein